MRGNRWFLGAILIIWGLSWFVKIDFWNWFWPVLLIIVGLRVMGGRNNYGDCEKVSETSEDKIRLEVIFNGVNKKVNSDKFEGGKIDCIFGGGKLDLSEVKFKNDKAELEINTILGQFKLRVPKDCQVVTRITEMVGGLDDRTRVEEGKTKLVLNGSVILGGVEIVN